MLALQKTKIKSSISLSDSYTPNLKKQPHIKQPIFYNIDNKNLT